MKKIIFFVNTYFQLIVAVNLKLTRFINDEVDIIVSNKSTDSEIICENLRKIKLFNEVYHYKFPKNSNISKNNIKGIMLKCIKSFKLLFLKKDLQKRVQLKEKKYDKFFFYNYTKEMYQLYDFLYSINNEIETCRFEEGYIGYLYNNNVVNKNYIKIRNMLKRKSFSEFTDFYYIFYPELMLYKTNSKIERIDVLNRNNKALTKSLNEIFDYKKVNDSYNQKYIFFEESFFWDNKNIDDLDLVLKIADVVGKENLLVKLHPRNRIDRFKDYGIATNKTIGIPWEIIQMNNDFSDKVFLTISSGSVLASKLYFGDNIKTYLLYNCTKKKPYTMTEQMLEYLKKINKKFDIKDFIVPSNENEFLERLKNEK